MMRRLSAGARLPPEHVSAVLSDSAISVHSFYDAISDALIGLGYDRDAVGPVALDTTRAALRLDAHPMPRAERVARALVLAGYAV